MDHCDVFICCLSSHSDGTHSLQRRCIGEQVNDALIQICSDFCSYVILFIIHTVCVCASMYESRCSVGEMHEFKDDNGKQSLIHPHKDHPQQVGRIHTVGNVKTGWHELNRLQLK